MLSNLLTMKTIKRHLISWFSGVLSFIAVLCLMYSNNSFGKDAHTAGFFPIMAICTLMGAMLLWFHFKEKS